MNILLETDSCLIVDKAPLWLSVPGRDPKDVRPILGRELEKSLKKQIYPIHRLDAEVSGLILYGKNPEFHKEANALFENKLIQKTYQAITAKGPFQKGEKVDWKCKLMRGKKRAYEADFGKPSHTTGWVLKETDKHLDWRLQPITGRAHQLRFELSRHKCAIFGDTLYGSTMPWPQGIALRAIQLNFPADFAERWELPMVFNADELAVVSSNGSSIL